MTSFKKFSLVSVAVLGLVFLSGCVLKGTSSMSFEFGNTLSDANQITVRYSDGLSASQAIQPSETSAIVQTDNSKTIVGYYVSDGIVSWVPQNGFTASTSSVAFNPDLTGITPKPAFPADHAIPVGQPKLDPTYPGYIDLTYAVYDANDKLVDDRTEVFAHASDPTVLFCNADPADYPSNGQSVAEGFSWYTVNGLVTFRIQSDISDISSKPISLFSGSNQININSSIASPDATLSSLSLSGITLDQTVSGDVTDYTATAPNDITSTTVTYATADSLATADLQLDGTSVSNPVNLSVGSNLISIVVTAENGATQTYTVNVTRAASSNADLSFLNLDGVTLDSTMSGDVFAYNAAVPNNVSVTTVTYTTDESHATADLQLNGASVNNPVHLSVGSNLISIVVTAQDGATQTYTVNVTRAASSNADLSFLNLDGITLDPTMSSDVYTYHAAVPNNVSVTTVTYTTDESHATADLQLNGASVNNPVNLSVGSNVISVVVTAQNGAKQTYTVNVTRAASGNAALSFLSLDGITLDPTMSGGVYTYNAAVPNNVSVTTVTYTTDESHATAQVQLNGAAINNPIHLSVGSNIISIIVTAQNGSTQTYTVNVTRAGSSNAALSFLNLDGITLDPTMSGDVYTYNAAVPYLASVTTVTYTTDESHATADLQLNGAAANNPIHLSVGSNVIHVVVTAQNGDKQTYTVNVTRGVPVASITVSSASDAATMHVGESLQFSASVAPAHAADKTFTWSVIPSNTGAATITADGQLSATHAGTVTVQASANDGSGVVGTKMISILSPSSSRSSSDSSAPTVTSPTPAPAPEPAPTADPAPASITDVFKSDVVKGDANVLQNMANLVQAALKDPVTATPSDTKGHWAEKTIDAFVQLHVINGYSDGSFKPDGNITRAEFSVILSRVFDIKGSGHSQITLKDVGNHWAKDSIENLVETGVISGYEDGTFKPDNTITREEMVVLLSRVLNLDNVPKDTAKGNFDDLQGSYAANEIRAAAQVGLISGKAEGKFDTKSSATRAEALKIILNALKLNPQLKTLLGTIN